MIWLFGDSIFHGHSLPHELETYTADMIAAEPLWPLRNPGVTMNLLWREQRVMPGLTGRLRMPHGGERALKEMRNILTSGRVIEGDAIVCLDVGEHHCDPDASEAAWLAFRRTLVGDQVLRLLMCTGFSDVGPGDPPFSGGKAEPYMHDLAFGGRSHNDALRAAASAPLEGRGTTELVETGAMMAALQESLRAEGSSAYKRDRIHPNIWGQTALAIMLCRALDPERPIHVEDALAVLDGQLEAERHGAHLRALAE